jgi:hypothetical protein
MLISSIIVSSKMSFLVAILVSFIAGYICKIVAEVKGVNGKHWFCIGYFTNLLGIIILCMTSWENEDGNALSKTKIVNEKQISSVVSVLFLLLNIVILLLNSFYSFEEIIQVPSCVFIKIIKLSIINNIIVSSVLGLDGRNSTKSTIKIISNITLVLNILLIIFISKY